MVEAPEKMKPLVTLFALWVAIANLAWSEDIDPPTNDTDETFVVEPEPDVQFRSVFEYQQRGSNLDVTLGWGRAIKQPNTPRNIGYLAINYREINDWKIGQIGLAVDAFQRPSVPKQGALKFRLYLYDEQSDIQQRHGFGVAVAPVFQPLSGMFVNVGFSARPFFTSFDWNTHYSVTVDWFAGIDWFLGNNLALTGGYQTMQGYYGLLADPLGSGWLWGVRLQF